MYNFKPNFNNKESSEVFSFKPNFNNKYAYDLPITRTPPEKESWQNSFLDNRPSSATFPEDFKPQNSGNNEQFQSKEDVAPYELPKWPYVENLWKDVDKIVGDLKTEEDILDKIERESLPYKEIQLFADHAKDLIEQYDYALHDATLLRIRTPKKNKGCDNIGAKVETEYAIAI